MGKLSRKQEQTVVRRYEEGGTLKEIATSLSVSTTPIVGALTRAGVERRKAAPRGGVPRPRPSTRAFDNEQAAQLAEQYEAGAMIAELAAEHGTSRKAVNNALRRQDVKLRDKRDAMAHWNRRRREEEKKHPNFKGGRVVTGDGYVLVALTEDDPFFAMAVQRGRLSAYRYGYALEHRVVMARHLSRPLTTTESVHHKNGDRSDNRIENLQLRSGKHGKHQAYCCADCGSRNIVADDLPD